MKKVRCINNKNMEQWYTLNKEYDVLYEKAYIYFLKDDMGCKGTVQKKFFEVVEEENKPQLKVVEVDKTKLQEYMEKVEDVVNNPNHYKLNGLDIEVIQLIKAVLTKEEFRGFLKGNIIKYNLRAGKKNGLQDYEKAAKYLKWLIEEIKGE